MQYRRFGDTLVIRLDPNEEIVEQLTALAEKENICLGEITGLGALKEFHICVFDVAEKKFYNNEYREPMELISLSGTITRMEGKPYLHIHASAGNGSGSAFGGHLKKAVISATGEILVRVIDGQVGRKYSEEIGLNLFHFAE